MSSMTNLMNAYDQVMDPSIRREAQLQKVDISGVQPKGGKDFVKCQEAYDQIFHPKQSPMGSPNKQTQVLSESENKELKLKKMGAIHFIKESLNKNIMVDDVDDIISTIKGIVSSL